MNGGPAVFVELHHLIKSDSYKVFSTFEGYLVVYKLDAYFNGFSRRHFKISKF